MTETGQKGDIFVTHTNGQPFALNVADRHPAVQEFGDMFEFEHLKTGLPQEVSALFADQAQALLDLLPDGPGLTRALHRLWEAKNEAVFLAVRTQKASG